MPRNIHVTIEGVPAPIAGELDTPTAAPATVTYKWVYSDSPDASPRGVIDALQASIITLPRDLTITSLHAHAIS